MQKESHVAPKPTPEEWWLRLVLYGAWACGIAAVLECAWLNWDNKTLQLAREMELLGNFNSLPWPDLIAALKIVLFIPGLLVLCFLFTRDRHAGMTRLLFVWCVYALLLFLTASMTYSFHALMQSPWWSSAGYSRDLTISLFLAYLMVTGGSFLLIRDQRTKPNYHFIPGLIIIVYAFLGWAGYCVIEMLMLEQFLTFVSGPPAIPIRNELCIWLGGAALELFLGLLGSLTLLIGWLFWWRAVARRKEASSSSLKRVSASASPLG